MSFLQVAQRVERIVYPVIKGVHRIGLGILLLMMFLTVADVLGRTLFLAPITGSYEVTEFMLALLVFSAVSYTQIQKGHISMEALVNRFPAKTQAIIESLVYFISLGLAAVMTWQLAVQAKRLWSGHNVTGVLSLPIHPFVIAAAFGSFLFCLVLFVDLLISLSKVRGNEP